MSARAGRRIGSFDRALQDISRLLLIDFYCIKQENINFNNDYSFWAVMTYFFGLVKQISLGQLMLLFSGASVVITFVLTLVLSDFMRDRAIQDLAREDARQTSQLVFQALYSSMRKGWNKQEINESIARLNVAFPGFKIKVYRGDIVAKQFGDMPGEHGVIARDDHLSHALQTGSDALLFPDKDEIRYLYPVIAQAECLVCHTRSHIGAVHGVVDITYPINNLKVSLSGVLNYALGYILCVVAVVFLTLYIKLRYMLVQPIANLVDVMREITQDMDLSRRVEREVPLLELQQLVGYFNGLLRTVHKYNAKLEELSSGQKQVMNQLRSTADDLSRANAQIEEERALLAQRVMERTAQLLVVNKAKDSFLATMSHEIRTPLGGLLGMMELLSLSPLDKEQNHMLHTAQNSGKSLLRIVDDILDWSKIEAGKMELAPTVNSLADTLKSVANTYAQVASSKGITLQYQLDDNLSAGHLFDRLRISQILNNFTSNAIKFTSQGSVVIYAQHMGEQDGSETVRFSVQDSGVGISPEQQSRLFQQYQQASNETARMYGGTGLGLAICRSLAELMEGTLSVNSSVGVGTTFYFTVRLPIANLAAQRDLQQQLERQERQERQQHRPAVEPLVTDGKPLRILVVDDHPVNRMMLKQQLEQLGLQVDMAESGLVALSQWSTSHYDLLVSDCHMPNMDGYELARSVREIEQQESRPRLPIIAWTANAMAEEQTRCREAGMDDLLTKPTELAELRAMLAKWLGKTARQDKPQSSPQAEAVHALSGMEF
jgi:signal transduction histidine kinase/FixJ family two-component response regulator